MDLRPQHKDYPIKPSHINSKRHFWNAFGHNETEISAGWIVGFCQKRGSWAAFPEEDLHARHKEKHGTPFRFNKLVDQDAINITDVGNVVVSHAFVAKCFLSSPAAKE